MMPYNPISKRLALLAALLAGLSGGCSRTEAPGLSIGSKNTVEQMFLAEAAAQYLERTTGARIARKLNWGETLAMHAAFTRGDIDVYPEYGCTAISAILRVDLTTDRNTMFERVRDEYKRRFRAAWLDPLGYDNRFQVGVLKNDAARLKLTRISDIERRNDGWRPGVTREIRERKDGFALLEAHYKIRLRAAPEMVGPRMFTRALDEERIDLIMAEAANTVWDRADVMPLDDHDRVFPPCEASFVMRDDADWAHPGARRALAELSGRFTLQAVREAIRQIERGSEAVESAAPRFLREAGLIR